MSSLLEGAAFEASWDSTLPPGLPLSSYSSAYEHTRRIFTGQGRLYGFTIFNSDSAQQYYLIFDSLQSPTTSQAPTMPAFPVAATSTLTVYFGSSGRWFTRGCHISNSSTPSLLTVGADDSWYDVQYVPVLSMNAGAEITA